MLAFALKVLVVGSLAVGAAEVARRSPALAAVVVSLPLLSIATLVLVYRAAGAEHASQLSWSIALVVLPSIALFVALPLLVRAGLHFYAALAIACVVTCIAYVAYVWLLARLGVDA